MNNIERIYDEARQLRGDEREAYLDRSCGNDSELRAEVERLLEADEQAGSFLMDTLDDPDATIPEAGRAQGAPVEQAGDLIGRYKLLQRIGEGGFGSVWMAEQKEPVRRRVALKIIKLGMDTKQVIARFEAERQALAMMDHPNIAKVLDAGSTDTGRPYFAMELVRGVPILEYCDTERIGTRERLNLFMDVCHAIQHAHQKGIIHRDIKPSNVLVTLHDGVPVPKVIDFGIAKATNQELTEKTLFTQHKQMIGTPAYMSPEQAEMSGLDIDTRSDIYSLGVLLYELLTGTTPFSGEDLMSKGFAEMMRIIREEEPHKPSTRLNTLGETSERTAQLRHAADIGQLGSLLRGDLDWISMRCLEKDRTRRYESASALAADIRRHLNDEPVEAGPPSTRYRMRKLIKRNRGAVLGGAAVACVLVLGIIGTSLGMVSAQRARQAEAEQRRVVEARFDAAKKYISRMASEVLPEMKNLIGAMTATKKLTDATAEFLDSLVVDEDDSPELRYMIASVRFQQGETLGDRFAANTIGDFKGAIEAYTQAYELLQTLPVDYPTPEKRYVLEFYIRDGIATAQSIAGEPEEAVETYLELEGFTRMMEETYADDLFSKPDPARRLSKPLNLRIGHVYSIIGDYEQAYKRYAATLNERLKDPVDLETADQWAVHRYCVAHAVMQNALSNLGRHEEALLHGEELLHGSKVRIRRWPNNARFARDMVHANISYAETLVANQRYGEFDGLVEEAVRRADELVEADPANGAFHWEYFDTLREAGGIYIAVAEQETDPASRGHHFRTAIDYLNRALTQSERSIVEETLDRQIVEKETVKIRNDISRISLLLLDESSDQDDL